MCLLLLKKPPLDFLYRPLYTLLSIPPDCLRSAKSFLWALILSIHLLFPDNDACAFPFLLPMPLLLPFIFCLCILLARDLDFAFTLLFCMAPSLMRDMMSFLVIDSSISSSLFTSIFILLGEHLSNDAAILFCTFSSIFIPSLSISCLFQPFQALIFHLRLSFFHPSFRPFPCFLLSPSFSFPLFPSFSSFLPLSLISI